MHRSHRSHRSPGRLALAILLATLLASCDDGGSDDTTSDTTASDTASDTAGSDTAADTSDPGDTAEPTTIEECVRGVPTNGRIVEYLTLETADGATRVRIARRITDGVAVGETFALELAAFGLEHDGGELVCITDLAAMGYVWGHHNWNETATATAPDGTAYELRLVLEVGEQLSWTDTLTASGAAAFGPLELDATDCATDPPGDLNFCLARPRSDQ